MFQLNGYMDIHVVTRNGIKEMSQLSIGDELIEYGTGKPLIIEELIQVSPCDIWELTYSDGRTQRFNITSKVFTGDKKANLISVLKHNGRDFTNVNMHPVELSGSPTGKLYPDPYIAGALIIYGEYGGEYINLPLDKEAANNLFAHKYDLDYADKLGDNRVYFSWNGNHGSNPITWNEFFSQHVFYAKDRDESLPLIPYAYQFSSMRDRQHFIQGVFDIGFDSGDFPDTVGISGKYEDRLKCVQWMLWSLGVNSTVTYDPTLPNLKGRNFRLDVKTPYERCPSFFYDINAIERQFTSVDRLIWRDKPFEVRVTSCKRCGRAWSYNPIFSEPDKLYLDDNFLPRVSE